MKRILITAGPTREYIDPVRFISNASSGQMGISIANVAIDAGYEVTLLLGPVNAAPPEGVKTLRFCSVDDLQKLLNENFDSCDVLVMAAAVGDFTVANKSELKIRRSTGPIKLELTPTPDLLASIAANRKPHQKLIGFAVADNDPDKVAREKLLGKNLDYIVVNPPAAMNSPTSSAAIIFRDGIILNWGTRTKDALAKEIVSLF